MFFQGDFNTSLEFKRLALFNELLGANVRRQDKQEQDWKQRHFFHKGPSMRFGWRNVSFLSVRHNWRLREKSRLFMPVSAGSGESPVKNDPGFTVTRVIFTCFFKILPVAAGAATGTGPRTVAVARAESSATTGTETFFRPKRLDSGPLFRRQDIEHGQTMAGHFILHLIAQTSDFLLHRRDFFPIGIRLKPEQPQFASLAEHLVAQGLDVFQVRFAQIPDLCRLLGCQAEFRDGLNVSFITRASGTGAPCMPASPSAAPPVGEGR
jgi:hypothetical protein